MAVTTNREVMVTKAILIIRGITIISVKIVIPSMGL